METISFQAQDNSVSQKGRPACASQLKMVVEFDIYYIYNIWVLILHLINLLNDSLATCCTVECESFSLVIVLLGTRSVPNILW